MTCQIRTRHLVFVCLFTSACLQVGCSYLTNFVVVNECHYSIEVRYEIKKPQDPGMPSRMPCLPEIKLVSELDRQVAWRELTATEYSFNPESRVVEVSLKPGEALRVAHLNLVDNQYKASDFPIEEIHLVASRGEINLRGEQVYSAFSPRSKKTYALTYR
jgi:hypothetical protein